MTIRDALYGDIEIEEEIVIKLLSTYEFQRLRKIKQLGLTYLLFPTAEHTRFSHSVGVYHLSTKVVKILEKKQGMQFDAKEKLAFNLACLLHDIGHGAFSHTSEEAFGLDHEDYSIAIIEDEHTDINKVLSTFSQELIDDITLFIKKQHHNKILVSAISSTIDIDRMDYLMRDSHFAGVVYGQFDVDRLIKLIDVEDDKMVFLEKGVRTLEDFIMARYHMFEQVYLNDKTIKYETLAIEILKRVKQLHEDNYRFKSNIKKLKPFLEGKPTVKEYVAVQDYYLLELINDFYYLEKDEYLSYLSEMFILQKPLKNSEDYKYCLRTQKIKKTLYKETVYIKCKDGSIKALEDYSPLVNFLMNDMVIEVDEMDVYLWKKN